MANKIGEIIREEDYSVFKELKGNRKDAENYNWKLQPENRLYFDKEYDQFQCITSAGYKKRWSEKKRAEGSK